MDFRRALGAGVLLLAILIGGGLALHLYPLTVHDEAVALRMRLGGVRRIRSGPLSGLERNTCRPKVPCRCVALLHGLGDTAATWRRLLQDEVGAPVPAGQRLVAFDSPGTNGSAAPKKSPAGYAIPEQSRALRAALEPICPRWTVVGNSLGGWTAAWLALQWPEGVERLILLSAAGLRDPSGLSKDTARILAEPTAENLKEFNIRVTHKKRELPDRVFEQMAAVIRSRPARSTVLAIKEEHFLEGRLGGLRMPVSILWGESDRVIAPAQAQAFKKEIPAATIELLGACGHLPQVECPEPVRRTLYLAR